MNQAEGREELFTVGDLSRTVFSSLHHYHSHCHCHHHNQDGDGNAIKDDDLGVELLLIEAI